MNFFEFLYVHGKPSQENKRPEEVTRARSFYIFHTENQWIREKIVMMLTRMIQVSLTPFVYTAFWVKFPVSGDEKT